METLTRRNVEQKGTDGESKTTNIEESAKKNKMFVQKIKYKLEELKTKTITEINDQVTSMMDELVREIDTSNGNQLNSIKENNKIATNSNEIPKSSRSEELPEKEFIARNSVLTDLFKVKHISTMYNIFVSILIVLAIHTVAHDYFLNAEIKLGLNLIYHGFGKLHIAISIWIVMFLSVLLMYVCFTIWANGRIRMREHPGKCKSWNSAWLAALVLYYLSLLYFVAYLVLTIQIGHLSAMVLLIEEIRLIMKMHAFIRSKVPKVLQFKSKDHPHSHSQDEVYHAMNRPSEEFSRYMYFLFAPTMVYRDSYPRNKEIRWNYVGKCFGEVILVIFLMSFMSERYFVLAFRNICKLNTTWSDILVSVLGSSIPSTVLLMSGFYCLLHAWLNGFAEMLRFADRLFYLDWWTSTSQGRFLRTWNLIIQDWLYTYIYRDCYQTVVPRNKIFAKVAVIVISAVVHEYILSVMLGFFLPVVLFEFGIFGLLVSFIKRSYSTAGNIQFFVEFALGNAIQFSFYVIELYARANYPIENEKWTDFFIPRFITCNVGN